MLAAENIYPLHPATPPDDPRRLAALRRYHLLDAAAGPDFALITELAATVCGTPYAMLTLVDEGEVVVKSARGFAPATVPRAQSVCALAVLDRDGAEIADLGADGRTAFLPLTRGEPPMRRYAAMPLLSPDGHAIGALSVMDTVPGTLAAPQRALLRGLAAQAMALVEAEATARALEGARARLEELVSTDPETGLHNRRALLQKLSFEVARTRRFRTPLSLLMLGLDPDLDQCREVNEHGGAAGDVILANVGRLLRENVRVIDVAGRYGGEELCVILPNTPAEGARKLADTLRAKLAAQIHREAGRLLPVTASIGVASFNHLDISDGDGLLRQAEAALQRAKEQGRNRVES